MRSVPTILDLITSVDTVVYHLSPDLLPFLNFRTTSFYSSSFSFTDCSFWISLLCGVLPIFLATSTWNASGFIPWTLSFFSISFTLYFHLNDILVLWLWIHQCLLNVCLPFWSLPWAPDSNIQLILLTHPFIWLICLSNLACPKWKLWSPLMYLPKSVPSPSFLTSISTTPFFYLPETKS